MHGVNRPVGEASCDDICAGCAREFNFEASVLRGVREKLRQIDLPDSLQARILAALGKAQ